jgi:hypothetical protein
LSTGKTAPQASVTHPPIAINKYEKQMIIEKTEDNQLIKGRVLRRD